MELKRVVVTGLGAITPLGNDVATTWQNAINGESGAGPITHFDASKFKTQFACEVKGFNAAEHFDRKALRTLDLYAQYAIVAARQAVDDSGIEAKEDLDKTRVGVIVAAGIGGLHTFEEEAGYYALHQEQGPKYNPFFIPKMIADIASGHISMQYGYHGPNYGTVSACASSNHSIIDSFNLIRLGKVDAMVTGGAEAAIFPAGVGGFNSMHALSTRNDDPKAASRPFSASRDGFVMGEGAAVLILEEYEHAVARGAKIYAEIVGGGMSADAYHITATHPEGLGAKLAMTNALADAEMKPEDIDYINTHGTSTPVGDPVEMSAIKNVFGSSVAVNSTKSQTGHMIGATGAAEIIFTSIMLEDDFVSPTINLEEPEEEFSWADLVKEYRPGAGLKHAISNSFAFGGSNACVALSKVK